MKDDFIDIEESKGDNIDEEAKEQIFPLSEDIDSQDDEPNPS